jgi:hypothetical protein
MFIHKLNAACNVILCQPLIARQYFKFRHQVLEKFRKPPILIYQMGKVGSSSVYKSLSEHNLGSSIYHIHNLNEDQAKSELTRHIQMSGSTRRYDFLWNSLHLSTRVKSQTTEKWPIVTLIREPVKRNISAFFQALDRINPELYQENLEGNINTKKLLDFFINSFSQHNVPEDWFDHQLKNVFGIDVFSKPFLEQKGYSIYENDKAKVLLLRLENLNACSENAFKEFLGIENFTLTSANIGEKKAYKIMYKHFLSNVNLPEDYIEDIYSSKFAKHFYSDLRS